MLSIALYIFPYFDTKGSLRPDSLHPKTGVLYATSMLLVIGILALGWGVWELWALRRSKEGEDKVINWRMNKGTVAGLVFLGSFHTGVVIFGYLIVEKDQPLLWLVRLNIGCIVFPVLCYSFLLLPKEEKKGD